MARNILYTLFMLILVPLFAGGAQAAAEPLGRLFSSLSERAALDQARQKFVKNGSATSAPSTISAPIEPPAADQITLDGYVRNSSGKLTAWINQTAQHDQEIAQGITLLKPGGKQTVSMRLPSGTRLNLKPGQTFDATKGKVREVYDDSTPPMPSQSK